MSHSTSSNKTLTTTYKLEKVLSLLDRLEQAKQLELVLQHATSLLVEELETFLLLLNGCKQESPEQPSFPIHVKQLIISVTRSQKNLRRTLSQSTSYLSLLLSSMKSKIQPTQD